MRHIVRRPVRFAVALALLAGGARAHAEPPAAIPDPEPYLSVQGASLAGVSRGGRTILFRMQRDGTSQLFRTRPEGGWPHRVTFRKAPVGLAALSPDGTLVVVGYDKDGDEDAGLVLVDVATGVEAPFAAKPGVQHGSVVWSRAGDRVFFRDNADSPADFHLREATLATQAVRTVLARPGAWAVEDVDAAGKRLLVSLARSNYDTSIYVLDLASGALAEIDPMPAGKTASAGEPRFVGSKGPGSATAGIGEAVVYLSDRGGERRRAWIARLDDANLDGTMDGTVREAVPPPEGGGESDPLPEADEVVPSADGTTVYVAENVGGWGRIVAADVATGERRAAPAVEGGIASNLHAAEGWGVAYTLSTPTGPPVVVRWHVPAETATRVTEPEWGGLSSADVPPPPRIVEIPAADGRRIPSWLWLPRGWAAGTKIPFVVQFHGGPEGQERPYFSADRAYLMSLGYGILAPNVRGSTGYGRAYRDLDNYRGRLDAVRDGKACADWLVGNAYAEPKRIAAMGGSYGGYMVLAELTQYPETWAAGVDVVGIANFETFLERTRPYRRALREAEYGPLSDREFLKSISPIHAVDRIAAPLLVAHGEQDPRVPVHEARQIVEALKARGRPVESLYFADEGHGWRKRENRATYLRAVASFLQRTIGR